MKTKKKIKINLWDYFDRVRLAAQKIALIEKALNHKDPKNESEAFDFIMGLGDDGRFEVNNNDEAEWVSSGYIRISFEYEDSTKKVVPEIVFELT